MVHIRSACLLLVLVVTVWHSIAYTHQDENAAAIEHSAVLTRKEPVDRRILTATGARDKRLGGRKMVVDSVTKPEKVISGSGANGGTSKSSSATHLVGKCDLECEQGVKSSLLPDEEVDAAGFVAFTADYHSPQQHPPTNN
ncbi:hypothetical protein L1049_005604 [Liquidambar formosana]|uniref:Uncharacterized protein n=1 Tax=Liquidambar formosana TaxID=63359 RepID=A0AAP0RFZ7_LIQFO